MIALMKRGKINKPVNIFDDWYKSGEWADNNIKQDFEKYYFQKVSHIKSLWLKLYLIIYV
jgi:hypothetical protein